MTNLKPRLTTLEKRPASQGEKIRGRERCREGRKVMVVRAIWRVCSAERVARRTPAFGFQMASGPRSEWNTMLYAAELNV